MSLHGHHQQHSHNSPYPPLEVTGGIPGNNGMSYLDEGHNNGQSMGPSSGPWVKSHPQHHHQSTSCSPCPSTMSGTGTCSPSSSSVSVSSSYGAPGYLPQQSFYLDTVPPLSTDGSGTSLRPNNNPNYNIPTVNNTLSPYYPPETRTIGTNDYYQHHQFPPFDPTKGQRRSSTCQNDEPVLRHGGNFYPSNNNTTNFYHGTHYSEFPSEYSRMQHYNNNSNSGNNSNGLNNSANCSNAADYFTGPSASITRPSSSCSAYSHHHVSTPLDFHHQGHQGLHLQSQPYRRNSIESFSTEPGDSNSPYNVKYASYNSNSASTGTMIGNINNRFTQQQVQIKRESVLPPAWSNEQTTNNPESEQEQQYFFSNNQQPQYHHRSHHHHHRCEPIHGTMTPPVRSSCSFDESGSTGSYKKGGGVKHRSQSLSYSRNNYETHHHFRSGASLYQSHQQHLTVSNDCLNKDLAQVPVTETQSQGYSSESSRTSNDTRSPRQGQSDDDGHEIPGNEDDDSDSSSASSSPSPKSTGFTSLSSTECNHSDDPDNISDLEEELKKEIENVTTTTGLPIAVGQKDVGQSTPTSPSNITVNVTTVGKIDPVENELSNSSLFDSIAVLNNFESPCIVSSEVHRASDMDHRPGSENMTEESDHRESMDLEDQDSCLSGLSSISSHHHHYHRHSTSSTCGEERSRSTSPGPQKIMKRSFSEADKELVLNTTAITTATTIPYNSRKLISVPRGWRREVSLLTNQNLPSVFYISPSETKLRNLEEVKNYITSDGTCKCGLSCPLHIEHAFSFDPKVRNGCDDGDSELSQNENNGKRLCCNGNGKRKMAISEDSPLISSTRDDLGDSGDGERIERTAGGKKRRTEIITKKILGCPKDESPNILVIPKSLSSSSSTVQLTHYSQNVSVPFAQQSPDTTTQTPQREMSPASSVSSETSSVTLSSRSSSSPIGTKSSPTTTMATLITPPGKSQLSEFAWPIPPGTTSLVRPQTPPSGQSWIHTSPNMKKSVIPNYQHHLISKSISSSSPIKRTTSPCPNVDVRQIPIEQNQPPPRGNQGQGSSTLQLSSMMSIIPSVGASHLGQSQSTVSLVPIHNQSTIVSSQEYQNTSNSVSHLNTGYSISPVLNNPVSQSTTGIHFANVLPSSVSYSSKQSMPRLVTSSIAPSIASTGIQQQSVPNSITISMIGHESSSNSSLSGQSLPKLVQKSVTNTVNSESTVEKCPLELVQDVVDRFHQGDTEEVEIGNNSINSVNTTPTVELNNNSKKENETERQLLESKIMKIIADAASASAKASENTNSVAQQQKSLEVSNTAKVSRCGLNVSMLPNSVPLSLPIMSTPPMSMSISNLSQTIFTSNPTVTTTSNSCSTNMPIMSMTMTPGGLQAGNSPLVNTSNTGLLNNGNQLILQSQQDPNNPTSLRPYPIFQTLQPIFLNSTSGHGPLLIPNGNDPQSYIQIDQNGQGHHSHGNGSELLHPTTMVLDPTTMSMCHGNGNILAAGNAPGPKKKKKRLSKKQQQQQAQLQLQQQLLLQQLFNHQQVTQQQHAQQQIPLLLPPSFNLGPQGFLQPMNMNMNMNFFPTPTILTLPNLILNPADGTLFIQQTGPGLSGPSNTQSTTTLPPTMKLTNTQLGQVPLQTTTHHQLPNTNLTTRKMDMITLTTPMTGQCISTIDPGRSSVEIGVDDSSRQNATPDSSTNDCQLGLIPSSSSSSTLQMTQTTSGPMTVSLPLGSSTNLQNSKKGPIKSKVVSSSTAIHKRILPQQKQILPKIDSTTPSVDNN